MIAGNEKGAAMATPRLSAIVFLLVKYMLPFFLAFYLRHKGIEGQVEGFFKCLALVFHEVGVFGYMYFNFSNLVSYLLRLIVEL